MANLTLPLLSAGNPVSGTDLIITRQGADTVDKKATAAQLRTYLLSSLAAVAVSGAYSDLSGTPSLGALAAKSSVDLGTGDATGTIAAGRMPAHTGDVTSSAGSLALTIANNAVSNAKAAQMATNTIKGNNTGSTANAADLTATQVTAMLDALIGDTGSGGVKGMVPAPTSGDAAAGKYLKADGTWAVPPGGGGSTGTLYKQIITATGDFTTPASTTASTVFKITLIGGGGSGATYFGSGSYGGGGGVGGTTGIVWVTGLAASTNYAVTIGAGGASKSGTNVAGANGGITTLVIGATTYTAPGGKGGASTNALKEAVTGTAATNCDISIVSCSTHCDGGLSGGGGDTPYGKGGPRRLASGATAGVGYGAGGAGCGTGGGTSGAGAAGAVIVEAVL